MEALEKAVENLQHTIIGILGNFDEVETTGFRKPRAKRDYSDAEIDRSQALIASVLGSEEIAKLKENNL